MNANTFCENKKIEGPWEKPLWHAVTFFIAKPLSGWHWSHVHLQWVTKSVSGSKKSRLFSRCPYLQKRWAAVDGSTFEIFRQLFLIKYCLLMLIQRGKQCYWVSVNPYLFIYLSISSQIVLLHQRVNDALGNFLLETNKFKNTFTSDCILRRNETVQRREWSR